MPALPREFVLVHGMSHGAWCWAPLAARLGGRGHRVVAVDLPGHGPRAHEWRRATLGAYARAVADAVIAAGLRRAVLVGHSMAGAVIPKAAELVEHRLAHLVFLAAVVPRHGDRLLDLLTPASRELLAGGARAGRGLVRYPAAMVHPRWLTDLPADDPGLGEAMVRLTAQPYRPWSEPIDLRRFPTLALPRTYIRCLRDQAVVPARAAEFAARLGVAPVDLDSDHGPMLSRPDALARVLEAT